MIIAFLLKKIDIKLLKYKMYNIGQNCYLAMATMFLVQNTLISVLIDINNTTERLNLKT